jgi:UDP-glucose 4-epimerase
VELVAGIDIRAPNSASSKLKFYSRDVREPMIDIFAQNKVDSAFHLAFVVAPNFRVDANDINIGGSQSFLHACGATSVEGLFYQSSHMVYGAHRDNPPLIAEEQPLRPVSNMPYGQDKTEVDLMFQEYMKTHPRQSVTIVRVVAVVGPGAGLSGLNVLFMPITMYVRGYDPGWQFIFEDDLARLDVTLVKERRSGVFNAGAEGAVPYRDMLRSTGKRSLGLPSWVWKPLISLTWALHIQKKSPAGALEYLKYPIIVNTEKLAKTTGFKFTMNSREAIKSYMDAKMVNKKAAKTS